MGNDYGAMEKAQAQIGLLLSNKAPTLAETTNSTIARLSEQLAEAQELAALLEKNPELERMITLFQKMSRGY